MACKRLIIILFCLVFANPALADEYSEATAYFQDKQYRSAVIVLKNILQVDPENYPARLLLGRAYLEMFNTKAAIKELENARDLSQQDVQYLIPLARAYFYAGKYGLVIAMEDQVGAAKTPAQQSELLTVIGYAYLKQKRQADGKANFSRAFELDENVYSLVALAQIENLEGNPEQAQNYLKRALERRADSTEALVAMGEILADMGRHGEAIDYFERALEIEAQLDNVRIALAESKIRIGDLVAARRHVERVLHKNANHLGASVLLLRLQFQAGDYQDAKRIGDQILRRDSQHAMTHFLLGATHYQLQNFEQARYFLEKYRVAQPLDIVAARLLAGTYLQLNEPEAAIELLSMLDSSYLHSDPDLLNLLGRAYLQAGEFSQGQEILERAMAMGSSSQTTRDMILLGALAEGRMEHALSLLKQRAEQDDSNMQIHTLLVMAYLQAEDFDKALDALAVAKDKFPQRAELYYLEGRVYEAMHDDLQAEAAYQKVLQLDETYISALTALANLKSRSGDSQSAKGFFLKILQLEPAHLNSLMALAQLSVHDGDAEALVDWLIKARERNPDSSIPVNFLVNHYLQTGKVDMASREANRFYLNHKDKLIALSLMARTSMARQDYQTAKTFLEKIGQVNPRDEVHRLQLAKLLIRLKDRPRALGVLNEVLAINKTNLQVLAIKFRLLLQDREIDAAADLVEQVQKYYPSHHLLYQLKGDLYSEKNEHSLAIAEYKKGFEQTQKPYFANALAKYYLSNGEAEEAVAILEKHLLNYPNDTQGRLLAASVLKQLDDYKRAITHYEFVAVTNPEDIRVLNNLALLYWLVKDPRSLTVAKKAYELAGDRPEVIDTYGWILLHKGDKKKALTLLQDSVSKAPENPDIRYHLAQAMYDNGKYQQSKKELDRLLRDYSGFSEQAAAANLLTRLSAQLEIN